MFIIMSSSDGLEYAPTTYNAVNYALFGIFGLILGSTVIAMAIIALIRNVLPALRCRIHHVTAERPTDVDRTGIRRWIVGTPPSPEESQMTVIS